MLIRDHVQDTWVLQCGSVGALVGRLTSLWHWWSKSRLQPIPTFCLIQYLSPRIADIWCSWNYCNWSHQPIPTDRNSRASNRFLPGLVRKHAYQPSLTRAGKGGLPGVVMTRTKVRTRVGIVLGSVIPAGITRHVVLTPAGKASYQGW